jgi:hypothetical protein
MNRLGVCLAVSVLGGCAAGTEVRVDEASDEVRLAGGGLAPFWIGRHEVTWGEFRRFREGRAASDGITRPTNAMSYIRAECPSKESLQDACPVTNVRWHSAMAYGAWLSAHSGRYYRLPTEKEWEFACGEGPFDAWHAGNSGGRARPVGERRPNAFGLFDMMGNVSEYCLEFASTSEYAPILKGGAWDTCPSALHPTLREEVEPYRSDPNLPQSLWWVSGGFTQGFRIARVDGAASREETEGYAGKIGLRILGAEAVTLGKGYAAQFFTRVTGEVRNGGPRTLEEIQIVVHALTPKGLPHWSDVGTGDREGRATFTWAHPALRNGGVPLRPGEVRRFQVDVPESLDDDKSVGNGMFGARVTAICFSKE